MQLPTVVIYQGWNVLQPSQTLSKKEMLFTFQKVWGGFDNTPNPNDQRQQAAARNQNQNILGVSSILSLSEFCLTSIFFLSSKFIGGISNGESLSVFCCLVLFPKSIAGTSNGSSELFSTCSVSVAGWFLVNWFFHCSRATLVIGFVIPSSSWSAIYARFPSGENRIWGQSLLSGAWKCRAWSRHWPWAKSKG